MKTVKQLIEQYDTLENRQGLHEQSLIDLAQIGLLEKEKLPLVDRALKMDAGLMSEAEKNALVNLLKSTASYFLYEASDAKPKELDLDSEDKTLTPPVMLYFKRQSIRVFPNNVKVAMYYSTQLGKYISVPFGKNAAEYLPMKLDEDAMTDAMSDDYSPAGQIRKELAKRSPGGAGRWYREAKAKEAKDRNKEAMSYVTSHRNLADFGAHGALQAAKNAWHGDGRPMRDRPLGAIGAAAHAAASGAAVGARVLARRTGVAARARILRKKIGLEESLFGGAKKKPKSLFAPVKPPKQKKTETKGGSIWNKTDLPKYYKKVIRAHRNANNDSIETWQDERKVTLPKKEYYASVAADVAARMKAKGISVPNVPEDQKRTPKAGVKPPPVRAESFQRNLDQIREGILSKARDAVVGAAKGAYNAVAGKPNKESSGKKPSSAKASGYEGYRTPGSIRSRNPENSLSTSVARLRSRQGNLAMDTLGESNLALLKFMVENKIPNQNISFGENEVTINNRIARKILTVYESLNKTNKKKIEGMLNEDANSFKKVINFAIRS